MYVRITDMLSINNRGLVVRSKKKIYTSLSKRTLRPLQKMQAISHPALLSSLSCVRSPPFFGSARFFILVSLSPPPLFHIFSLSKEEKTLRYFFPPAAHAKSWVGKCAYQCLRFSELFNEEKNAGERANDHTVQDDHANMETWFSRSHCRFRGKIWKGIDCFLWISVSLLWDCSLRMKNGMQCGAF